MVDLRECLTEQGRSPYAEWFEKLTAPVAAKVAIALSRIQHGNTSSLKSMGDGVSECRIDFGPGYRIYLAWDGPVLLILLGGGTKKRQQRDVEAAKTVRQAYKRRKKQEK